MPGLNPGVAIELNTENAYRRSSAAPKGRPFVACAMLSGAMFMQYFVLALLLPVWVVYHTHAPRWSVSAFALITWSGRPGGGTVGRADPA
jgi:hypothetical protein